MPDASHTPAFRCTNPRCYRVGTQVPAATGSVCRWPDSCARPQPNAFATPTLPTKAPPPLPRPTTGGVPVSLPGSRTFWQKWRGCLLPVFVVVAVVVLLRNCVSPPTRQENRPVPPATPTSTPYRTVESSPTPDPTLRRFGASPAPTSTPTPAATLFFDTPLPTPFFIPPARTPTPTPPANHYTLYEHPRHQYSVWLPPDWLTLLNPKENGDRLECLTRDGKQLLILVRNTPRSLQELYQQHAAEHTLHDPLKTNDYAVIKPDKNWFVVSGYNGPRGYYIKGYKRGNVFLFLALEYDQHGPNVISDDDIKKISRSFPND